MLLTVMMILMIVSAVFVLYIPIYLICDYVQKADKIDSDIYEYDDPFDFEESDEVDDDIYYHEDGDYLG